MIELSRHSYECRPNCRPAFRFRELPCRWFQNRLLGGRLTLGSEAQRSGGNDAGLEKYIRCRVVGVPHDDKIVAVAREGFQVGRGRFFREYEHAPVGAAILAGRFDFLAGLCQSIAILVFGFDGDERPGRRAIGAKLDDAVADSAVLDETNSVPGGSGHVARVLRLTDQELADGVFKHEAMPRAAFGFLALRDDLSPAKP